jgi:hypothetical protein
MCELAPPELVDVLIERFSLHQIDALIKHNLSPFYAVLISALKIETFSKW